MHLLLSCAQLQNLLHQLLRRMSTARAQGCGRSRYGSNHGCWCRSRHCRCLRDGRSRRLGWRCSQSRGRLRCAGNRWLGRLRPRSRLCGHCRSIVRVWQQIVAGRGAGWRRRRATAYGRQRQLWRIAVHGRQVQDVRCGAPEEAGEQGRHGGRAVDAVDALIGDAAVDHQPGLARDGAQNLVQAGVVGIYGQQTVRIGHGGAVRRLLGRRERRRRRWGRRRWHRRQLRRRDRRGGLGGWSLRGSSWNRLHRGARPIAAVSGKADRQPGLRRLCAEHRGQHRRRGYAYSQIPYPASACCLRLHPTPCVRFYWTRSIA